MSIILVLFVSPILFDCFEVNASTSINDEQFHTNAMSASIKWSFKTQGGGGIYSSPVFADMNNDSKFEVLFGSNDYKFYCLDQNGSQV